MEYREKQEGGGLLSGLTTCPVSACILSHPPHKPSYNSLQLMGPLVVCSKRECSLQAGQGLYVLFSTVLPDYQPRPRIQILRKHSIKGSKSASKFLKVTCKAPQHLVPSTPSLYCLPHSSAVFSNKKTLDFQAAQILVLFSHFIISA